MSTRTPATEGQANIRQAAQAIINRWDDPKWEWDKHGHTAGLIADLRNALDASPPIVGELTEEEIKRIAEHESEFAQHFADGLRYARDHGYLAQAPQSSPAPSVIEAGDAMENMMRRLRTQRDDEGILPTGNDFNGMDGLCAAWVAAKASRPSVTAPQGVTVDQIMKVVWTWAMDAKMVSATTEPYYLTNDLRSRLSALPTNPK